MRDVRARPPQAGAPTDRRRPWRNGRRDDGTPHHLGGTTTDGESGLPARTERSGAQEGGSRLRPWDWRPSARRGSLSSRTTIALGPHRLHYPGLSVASSVCATCRRPCPFVVPSRRREMRPALRAGRRQCSRTSQSALSARADPTSSRAAQKGLFHGLAISVARYVISIAYTTSLGPSQQ